MMDNINNDNIQQQEEQRLYTRTELFQLFNQWQTDSKIEQQKSYEETDLLYLWISPKSLTNPHLNNLEIASPNIRNRCINTTVTPRLRAKQSINNLFQNSKNTMWTRYKSLTQYTKSQITQELQPEQQLKYTRNNSSFTKTSKPWIKTTANNFWIGCGKLCIES
jgi:hypothetical protein